MGQITTLEEHQASVKIVIDDSSNRMVIPWNPETISINGNEIRVAEYEVINLGKVQVPTGSNLRTVSWDSTFPGEIHCDLPFLVTEDEGGVYEPQSYIDQFETWKKEGTKLRLTIVQQAGNIISTHFDEDVLLADYNSNISGGVGDIGYDVKFTERRDLWETGSGTGSGGGGKIMDGRTGLQRRAPRGTHTVVKGDTLYSISVKYFGDGRKKDELYRINKDAIEKADKAYRKKHKIKSRKSSQKGKYLHAGTVLSLVSAKY